jgi:hypothetical protein
MTVAVTDVRGTAQHQIAVAAQALGQSSQRRAVFREIHSGKRRIKTVAEIAQATALPRKRVLEEAVKLVHKQIIRKTKRDGDTAYERDNFYYVNLREIFRRADGLGPGGRPSHSEREERAKSAPLKLGSIETSSRSDPSNSINWCERSRSHKTKAASSALRHVPVTRIGGQGSDCASAVPSSD